MVFWTKYFQLCCRPERFGGSYHISTRTKVSSPRYPASSRNNIPMKFHKALLTTRIGRGILEMVDKSEIGKTRFDGRDETSMPIQVGQAILKLPRRSTNTHVLNIQCDFKRGFLCGQFSERSEEMRGDETELYRDFEWRCCRKMSMREQ